jgi:hypothetical protein
MTRRRLIAIFLAWHLFAIAVAALPPPDRLSQPTQRDPSASPGPVFYRITLALDAAARAVEIVESGLWRLTRPVHPAINYYLGLTGLSQNWAMFANPPTTAQYLRVRYYVEPRGGGRAWVATELVWPSNREDRVRTFQSFRDSYRDKALAVASGRFYDRRKPAMITPGARPEELPDDLAPVARYFSRAFARTHLDDTEEIVRTEVWFGNAPIPPLGTQLDEADRRERALALQAYYDGPVEQRLTVPAYPPYHAGEREADIEWLLEYFEER